MWRAGVLLWVMALPALAEGPESSLFPKPRPAAADGAVVATADAPVAGAATTAAPVDPELAAAAIDVALDAVAAAAPPPETGTLLASSIRPRARPAQTETVAEPAAAPRGNGICGNPALTGQAMDRIGSRTNGCGVAEPVQISAVDGVRLSTPATMDCTTANALAQWVEQGLRPAFEGQQIVGLQVAGHYICRTRNHRPGARISEHGRGKAIDISGLVFADGTVMTVSNNWNRQMRSAHQAACGIFGTTLGPGSDGYHEDHMHFDTASHRNGPYCR